MALISSLYCCCCCNCDVDMLMDGGICDGGDCINSLCGCVVVVDGALLEFLFDEVGVVAIGRVASSCSSLLAIKQFVFKNNNQETYNKIKK